MRQELGGDIKLGDYQGLYCQAQPQLQLQLWLRLVLFLNSSSHPPDKQWHLHPDQK